MAAIKMRVTVPGSMDGLTSKKFVADKIYEINDIDMNQRLAKMILKSNLAVRVVPDPSESLTPPEPLGGVLEAPEKKDDEDLDIDLDDESDETEDADSGETVLRVYQLADELGKGSKDIIEIAKTLDIQVTAPSSGLTATQVDKIRKSLSE